MSKKKLIYALLLCFFGNFLYLNAQLTNLTWVKKLEGMSNEIGFQILTDLNGNVYTLGFFDGTTDFDSGSGVYNLTTNGNTDIFLCKIDASGSFVWAKQLGGADSDIPGSITLDVNGYIYITGAFKGTMDFDPGLSLFNLTTQSNVQSTFILKLDTSGNFVWARQLGGTGSASGLSITIDQNGYVYTAGTFLGIIDFDPGAASYALTANILNIFVSKLDASGSFIWAKQFGGSNNGVTVSIRSDNNGNIYVSGAFQGTADFDPGISSYNLTSSGGLDAFLSKLDVSGNFVWAKQIGGINGDSGNSLCIDVNGNAYMSGHFQNSVDFDPGPGTSILTSMGGTDIFISKYDVLGNYIWAKQIGGSNDDASYAMSRDGLGNLYNIGVFQGTTDFDPGVVIHNLTPFGNYDIFVSKIDDSGNFVWANQFGGAGFDLGYGITIDGSGNIFTTGCFSGTADFDSGLGIYNLTSGGNYDGFTLKLSQTPTTQLSSASCGITETVLNQVLTCDPIAGATSYKYELTPSGGGPVLNYTYGSSGTSFCLSWVSGIGYGVTYSIKVSALVAGVWTPWGSACNVTTPAPPVTQISTSYCGITLTSLGQLIYSDPVLGATAYKYELVPSGGGTTLNHFYGANTNPLSLSWVAGIGYGVTYSIRVAASVGGTWTAWGSACNVTTLAPPVTQISSSYCGITLTSLGQLIYSDPVLGATAYKYELVPSGGGTTLNHFYGANANPLSLSWVAGIGYGVTYSIRVAASVGGTWTAWGSACNVTTPAPPVTQISSSYCGITLTSLGQLIYSDPVLGATAYKYELVPSGGGTTLNYFYGANANPLSLSWVAGIGYGVTYSIRVAASVGGTWTAWGSACNVTTPAPPTTQLSTGSCGITLSALNQMLSSDVVLGATAYKYELTPSGGGTVLNYLYGASATHFNMSWVSGVNYGVTYNIKVSASVGGTWTPWGSACNVTTPAGPKPAKNNDNYDELNVTGLDALETNSSKALSILPYPNPTDREFTIDLGQVYEQIELGVLNMFGQEVYRGNYHFTNLIHMEIDEPKGIYFITLHLDKHTVKTIKVIKQ